MTNSFAAEVAFNNFLGNRKTPNIPPLIVNNFVILDFTTKATLFNNFFSSQYCPMVSSSTLTNFSYKTQKRISDFEIKEDDNQKFDFKQSTWMGCLHSHDKTMW